jgi:competence ComEA-like helix-hairpin-helix protein
MNRRERAVLLLLIAAFVSGAAITWFRRARLARQSARTPIAVVCSPESARGSPAVPGPIDLNQSTARQLEALPGIGPVLAGRIVEYRLRHGGFHSVSELRSVSGIGPKRYAGLKDLVFVGPGPGKNPESRR